MILPVSRARGKETCPWGLPAATAGGPQPSARCHPKPQQQLSNSEKKGENVTTPEVSSPRPHPGRLAHLQQEPESTPGLLWWAPGSTGHTTPRAGGIKRCSAPSTHSCPLPLWSTVATPSSPGKHPVSTQPLLKSREAAAGLQSTPLPTGCHKALVSARLLWWSQCASVPGAQRVAVRTAIGA